MVATNTSRASLDASLLVIANTIPAYHRVEAAVTVASWVAVEHT